MPRHDEADDAVVAETIADSDRGDNPSGVLGAAGHVGLACPARRRVELVRFLGQLRSAGER